MIHNGYEDLQPLFAFRNWLSVIRDQSEFRCKVRRNGRIGLEPITLSGRKIILQRLLQTQRKSGLKLIENDELVRIKELWLSDKSDSNYREN
jgi:DNA sulfur modification protein DndC